MEKVQSLFIDYLGHHRPFFWCMKAYKSCYFWTERFTIPFAEMLKFLIVVICSTKRNIGHSFLRVDSTAITMRRAALLGSGSTLMPRTTQSGG